MLVIPLCTSLDGPEDATLKKKTINLALRDFCSYWWFEPSLSISMS